MRAVIDTNVLISTLFWGGGPRRIVDMAAAGQFQAVTSAELLAELEDVLAEDFAVPEDRLDLILRDVLSHAEVVSPVHEVAAHIRDAGDIKVMACAIGGGADCIITGDEDLLSLGTLQGVRVVSVRQFLESRA